MDERGTQSVNLMCLVSQIIYNSREERRESNSTVKTQTYDKEIPTN
jgi:hypothetical protein